MDSEKSHKAKPDTFSRARGEMLTPSEIESLREDNIRAHHQAVQLIAERKRLGLHLYQTGEAK